MEALNGPSLKSAKGAFKMTVKARAMLVLIGIGLSTCVSPAYAAEYSDSPDQSTTGDIKADIFVENFAWVSNTIYLWANHVAIDKPEEDFCDPADPDPDCKDPLGRGYTVDSSYLNLNQSHTFKIDRSRLYLGDITLEAELVVSTPSQADCTQTTQATSYIYIVSTDSFEQCTANTHVRYLRQYFYLNAAYPGKQALNNLDDFTIYNEIEEHGTVFYAYWKLD
ncbi:hypothetical protein GCM10007898_36690 [Dyella flagellata]|uniref:Uncharacterized protein n=2 Tax=Dyella flagellata TaxID=1867833 RepID=A0ABQ5XHY7_9GAMM|nr:hypothetical protein GCM10007898_36690 [Dyella flagellata]